MENQKNRRLGGIVLRYNLNPEQRDYSFGSGFYMRISDDIRKCVVFLGYADNTPGGGGIYCVGTGFLLHYKDVAYLVTVKHVALALGSKPFVFRVNRHDGSSGNLHGDQVKWYYHPDENVDIAVIPCSIGLESGFDALYISDTLISPAGEKNIGIGDMCYTIGLFRLLAGEGRNLPVVHTGNIALLPGDEKIPVRDWDEPEGNKSRYIEGYLIESQSLDGLSGSPVLARPTIDLAFGRDESGEAVNSKLARSDIFLIGIWQGAWTAPPDEVMSAEMAQGKSVRVSLGMGVVVPITKLLELLETSELQKQRMAIYAERKAKIHAADMDSVKIPSNMDNPQHKEDFTSLVGAAVKKKPQVDET